MLVEMNEHDQDCLAVGVRQSLCPLQDVPHPLDRHPHSEAGNEHSVGMIKPIQF